MQINVNNLEILVYCTLKWETKVSTEKLYIQYVILKKTTHGYQ